MRCRRRLSEALQTVAVRLSVFDDDDTDAAAFPDRPGKLPFHMPQSLTLAKHVMIRPAQR